MYLNIFGFFCMFEIRRHFSQAVRTLKLRQVINQNGKKTSKHSADVSKNRKVKKIEYKGLREIWREINKEYPYVIK